MENPHLWSAEDPALYELEIELLDLSLIHISSGNMVLYQPKEIQKYVYYVEDHPEVFWIHFTGYDVDVYKRQSCFLAFLLLPAY